MWRGVVRCGVVRCGVVWCGVEGCGVVWCGVVWCGVVLCGAVWCGVVWCGMARAKAIAKGLGRAYCSALLAAGVFDISCAPLPIRCLPTRKHEA